MEAPSIRRSRTLLLTAATVTADLGSRRDRTGRTHEFRARPVDAPEVASPRGRSVVSNISCVPLAAKKRISWSRAASPRCCRRTRCPGRSSRIHSGSTSAASLRGVATGRASRGQRRLAIHGLSATPARATAAYRTRRDDDGVRAAKPYRTDDRGRHPLACARTRDRPRRRAFCASDPELLEWVHATACFGFVEAYHAYVRPLTLVERDRFFSEGVPAAELYGARSVPESQSALEALFARVSGQLQPSDIVLEFLRIMRHVPALSAPLQSLQGVLAKAAIELIAAGLPDRIGLGKAWSLAPRQRIAGDATEWTLCR